MTQEERNEHLLRLLPAIQSQATHYVTRYASSADFDEIIGDVIQESAKAFLERAQADPAFLDQPDKAIAHRCVLDGWNAVRSQLYQESCQINLAVSSYDHDTPDPEEAAMASDLAERVQEVVARLKPDYQTVCHCLMSGSTRTAAMEAIGAKKQAWSYYHGQLQSAFASVTGQPQPSAAFAPAKPQKATIAPMEGELWKVGPLTLDLTTRHLTVNEGEPVHLSPREFALLHLLMQHPEQPIRRQKIGEALRGTETKSLRAHVARLRKKIEPDPSHPIYLKTHRQARGARYCLSVALE